MRFADTQAMLKWNSSWKASMTKEQDDLLEQDNVFNEALNAVRGQYLAIPIAAPQELAISQAEINFNSPQPVVYSSSLHCNRLCSLHRLGTLHCGPLLHHSMRVMALADPRPVLLPPPRSTASLMWS